MRFSSPMTASRLRRPISESTTATLLPCIARAVPIFAVVVVLPTPPFPDVMVITRLFIRVLQRLRLSFSLFTGRATVDPGFDDDTPIANRCHLRARLYLHAIRWSREQMGNTQLHRG